MKNIIITGASSGIGKAATELFLERDWRVIMVDRVENVEFNESIKKDYGDMVFFYKADVSKFEEMQGLYNYINDRFEKVDSIINNAGIIQHGYLHEVTEEERDNLFSTDVKAIYYMTKLFIVDMIKNGGGTIVNTASISGLYGDYKMPVYNAAKGAVVNLTRSMALDYAKFDIRVNSICPSAIRTPLVSNIEPHIEVNPMKRIGEAIEAAKAIYFLASDESSFINGVNLSVDGGLSAHTGQPQR